MSAYSSETNAAPPLSKPRPRTVPYYGIWNQEATEGEEEYYSDEDFDIEEAIEQLDAENEDGEQVPFSAMNVSLNDPRSRVSPTAIFSSFFFSSLPHVFYGILHYTLLEQSARSAPSVAPRRTTHVDLTEEGGNYGPAASIMTDTWPSAVPNRLGGRGSLYSAGSGVSISHLNCHRGVISVFKYK
jgi:hypothetical protein